MSDVKYPEIEVDLTSIDGNAFSIMGTVKKALQRGGVSKEEIEKYISESTSGDYDNVIITAMKWINCFPETDDDNEKYDDEESADEEQWWDDDEDDDNGY